MCMALLPGKNALLAIKLITELHLYPSIFHIPPQVAVSFSGSPGPLEHGLAASYIFSMLTSPSEPQPVDLPPLHPVLASAAAHEPSTRARLYLACALTPYRSITYRDHKKKTHLAVEGAIREGTKLGAQNHYLDGIPALFKAADVLQNLTIGGENERVRMGTHFRPTFSWEGL